MTSLRKGAKPVHHRYRDGQCLNFHLPLMRVRSISPCVCISSVAPPRRKEYGRKPSAVNPSWSIPSLNKVRKAVPLPVQHGTLEKPCRLRRSSIAWTVSIVMGSERLTLSRELFRTPLLLLGRLTKPLSLSRIKSQGLTWRISPVLSKQWNPKRTSAAITR